MPLPKLKYKPKTQQSDQGANQMQLDRPSAEDIYEQVARNARLELNRSNLALFVSGLAGGITMGLTALAVSIATAELGTSTWAKFVAYIFYPVGFLTVILGRAQLFTENTLYPVALVLTEHRKIWSMLRLWGIVLVSNVLGAFLFALLCTHTAALKPEYVSALSALGVENVSSTALHIFWSGVIGGWLIAMVAWLVSASHSITGSAVLIWMLAFVVGLGHFAHCIAASGEILAAVLVGALKPWQYPAWLLPAVLGNICGGVIMVTLLEYGQTQSE